MAIYIESSNLNDAEYFLNHARGLPLTTTGKRRLSVYTKSVVVFAWMALEEFVRVGLETFPVASHPHRLWDQLDFLITSAKRPTLGTFDRSKASFSVQRKVRNGVAHAQAGVTVPPGTSPNKYVASAFAPTRTPACQTMMTAINNDAISAVRADANGTLPGVPPGTYYLMISVLYNNQPMTWGQAVEIKPGQNSLTLNLKDAKPIN